MQKCREAPTVEKASTKVPMAKSIAVLILCLRILGLVAPVVATWVMFTSNETALVYGVPMSAKYSYTSAFKFYAVVTAVTSAFSLVSLTLMIIFRWKGLLTRKLLICFFFHDLIILLLLLSACAAASAIGVVGEHGNDHAGWVPICDSFHTFCHRVIIAVMFGYLGVFSFFSLTIIYVLNSNNQALISAHVDSSDLDSSFHTRIT